MLGIETALIMLKSQENGLVAKKYLPVVLAVGTLYPGMYNKGSLLTFISINENLPQVSLKSLEINSGWGGGWFPHPPPRLLAGINRTSRIGIKVQNSYFEWASEISSSLAVTAGKWFNFLSVETIRKQFS